MFIFRAKPALVEIAESIRPELDRGSNVARQLVIGLFVNEAVG